MKNVCACVYVKKIAQKRKDVGRECAYRILFCNSDLCMYFYIKFISIKKKIQINFILFLNALYEELITDEMALRSTEDLGLFKDLSLPIEEITEI